MIRPFLAMAATVGLVACAPEVPNSAPSGPGFTNDIATERARREAALQGQPGLGDALISDEGTDGADGTEIAALDTDTSSSIDRSQISDEQDFEAVSERETIESDAERIARQRDAYQVIEPTALPQRPSGTGPSIVEFALSTTNRVGEQVYSRSGINAENRFTRACARYASADMAQEAFLASGGPERDRRGMDPDGDGFACAWDPTPFRTARAATNTGR